MISLRNHVYSLIAVFLALAVGLALGGGLLGDGGNHDSGSTSGTSPSPDSTSGDPDAVRTAAYAERFVSQGMTRLYAGGLTGHAVAILAFPGVDQRVVKTMNSQVTLAGGSLTGTYTLSSSLLEVSSKADIDTLGIQLETQLGDPRLDAGASTYERMGQLLGLAMATTQLSSQRADAAAVSLRQSLATGKLLTSPADVRLAPLILIVLPPGDSGNAKNTPTLQAILSGVVNGMTTVAAGVVAVGDTLSAAGGELEALRSSELAGPASTVDGVESPLGQATAILALESVLGGTGGSYGASGRNGPVPLQ